MSPCLVGVGWRRHLLGPLPDPGGLTQYSLSVTQLPGCLWHASPLQADCGAPAPSVDMAGAGGSSTEAQCGAATGRSSPSASTPPTKKARVQESPSSSTPLTHDPAAYECPFSACEYDCQKHAPVRVPCTCKRLVCRKCAGVAGAMPQGCGLCGAAGVEYGAGDCERDMGLVVSLAALKAPYTKSYVDAHDDCV